MVFFSLLSYTTIFDAIPAGSGVPSFGNQLGKSRAKVPRRFWGTEL